MCRAFVLGKVIGPSIHEFALLSRVPVLYRPVVSGDARISLSRVAANRAGVNLSVQIAVVLTDRIGRAERKIGDAIQGSDFLYKFSRGLPIEQSLSQKGMKDCSARVLRLEGFLFVQGFEDILGVVYGKMGGVGVIRRFLSC